MSATRDDTDSAARPVELGPQPMTGATASRDVIPRGGAVAAGFEPVLDAFVTGLADLGPGGGAFAAYHHGRQVVNLWGGWARPGQPWREDTLAVVLSCSKGVSTLCLQMVHDRGGLDLDGHVSDLWPEFGTAGKEAVRVRHVLAHTSGVLAPVDASTLLSWRGRGWSDYEQIEAGLAAAAPAVPIGCTFAYHALSYGWLMDSLLRRTAGQSVGRFLEAEIARSTRPGPPDRNARGDAAQGRRRHPGAVRRAASRSRGDSGARPFALAGSGHAHRAGVPRASGRRPARQPRCLQPAGTPRARDSRGQRHSHGRGPRRAVCGARVRRSVGRRPSRVRREHRALPDDRDLRAERDRAGTGPGTSNGRTPQADAGIPRKLPAFRPPRPTRAVPDRVRSRWSWGPDRVRRSRTVDRGGVRAQSAHVGPAVLGAAP